MAILLAGTKPPARPAISIANDRECPVPNTWTTPPAATDSAMIAAPAATASCCVATTCWTASDKTVAAVCWLTRW